MRESSVFCTLEDLTAGFCENYNLLLLRLQSASAHGPQDATEQGISPTQPERLALRPVLPPVCAINRGSPDHISQSQIEISRRGSLPPPLPPRDLIMWDTLDRDSRSLQLEFPSDATALATSFI